MPEPIPTEPAQRRANKNRATRAPDSMRYFLYRRPEKTGSYWIDVRLNGCRYRDPLGTRDTGEAHELMLKRVEQLKAKAPDPKKRSKSYGAMDIATAMEAYIQQRRAKVSPRMCVYWDEQSRPLAKFFGNLKLKNLTAAHIDDYQNRRLESGNAPKTINGEVGVLRQLLKHAKLWYRFEDYKSLRNTKPPVGIALTAEEQARLFEVAQSRSDWLYAFTAAVLGAYCGMRGCEIKRLQWKDVDFVSSLLDIKYSKTPAGWRKPTLNTVCKDALSASSDRSANQCGHRRSSTSFRPRSKTRSTRANTLNRGGRLGVLFVSKRRATTRTN